MNIVRWLPPQPRQCGGFRGHDLSAAQRAARQERVSAPLHHQSQTVRDCMHDRRDGISSRRPGQWQPHTRALIQELPKSEEPGHDFRRSRRRRSNNAFSCLRSVCLFGGCRASVRGSSISPTCSASVAVLTFLRSLFLGHVTYLKCRRPASGCPVSKGAGLLYQLWLRRRCRCRRRRAGREPRPACSRAASGLGLGSAPLSVTILAGAWVAERGLPKFA